MRVNDHQSESFDIGMLGLPRISSLTSVRSDSRVNATGCFERMLKVRVGLSGQHDGYSVGCLGNRGDRLCMKGD